MKRASAPGQSTGIHVRFDRSGITKGRAQLGAATRRLAAAVAAELGYPGAEVSLLYCSKDEMERLNASHLGEDRPTDVLSFPARRLRPNRVTRGVDHLGDIAVCVPYVATSELKGSRAIAEEVALLIVHGMLHLVGHDHDSADRKRLMWAETRRLLALPEARDLAGLQLGVRG